ncbi:uncharacterized protein BDW70DRAFT_146673 [Aspergillus foveolatus]|uniref:uncharacterized protein n=1 Tax=Aspergillus foveolatus TaxID=210207 RepID=UPI003CCD0B42
MMAGLFSPSKAGLSLPATDTSIPCVYSAKLSAWGKTPEQALSAPLRLYSLRYSAERGKRAPSWVDITVCPNARNTAGPSLDLWERFPNDLICLQRLSRGRSTPLEYRSSRWGATVRGQGIAGIPSRLLKAAE